jgi:hypothetical protein
LLKTFTSARDHGPVAFVNVLEICCYDWPVFRCPSLAGFGCPPRRVERSGAYTRWREALEHALAVSVHVSVAGESRDAREHRISALRSLLTLHR